MAFQGNSNKTVFTVLSHHSAGFLFVRDICEVLPSPRFTPIASTDDDSAIFYGFPSA